jgi:hypothetical protein
MDKFYIDNGTVTFYVTIAGDFAVVVDTENMLFCHRGTFTEEEDAARVAATAQNKIENGESFSFHEWVPV